MCRFDAHVGYVSATSTIHIAVRTCPATDSTIALWAIAKNGPSRLSIWRLRSGLGTNRDILVSATEPIYLPCGGSSYSQGLVACSHGTSSAGSNQRAISRAALSGSLLLWIRLRRQCTP